MTDHLAVTRTAEFDLSPDELWALVADGSRWGEWMVDRADVAVVPGGRGLVVDEGVARTIHVRTVAHGRVVFEWRPVDSDPGDTSVVEIEVTPTDGGERSRLRVVETFATANAGGGIDWDLRLLAMCCCVAACCRT